MIKNKSPKVAVRAVFRWAAAAALTAAVIFSGYFAGLMNRAGLFFLLLGSAASVLMSFSRHEIGDAFRLAAGGSGRPEDMRRASTFWRAAGRNAWILGVLGSVLNFTVVLGGGSGGLAETTGRMVQSFLITLYGLVLAVLCLVPAMKLAGHSGTSSPGAGRARPGLGPSLFERAAGYAVFVLVVGLTVFSLAKGTPQDGPLTMAGLLFHGPAALVVIGGAITLALFLGSGSGARALAVAFGMTGLVALLAGIIQAMFGFVQANIQEVAASVSFIISASLYSLLGLVLFAAPREDRELMDGFREGPGRLSGMIWKVLPLVAFLVLILTFIMVITPMKKAG